MTITECWFCDKPLSKNSYTMRCEYHYFHSDSGKVYHYAYIVSSKQLYLNFEKTGYSVIIRNFNEVKVYKSRQERISDIKNTLCEFIFESKEKFFEKMQKINILS